MSKPPSYTEVQISQIPALQVLQKLGYQFLGSEECAVERGGKRGLVLLEGILESQLKRINRFSLKGREHEFSESSIREAVARLRDLPYEGLVRTSEQVYDLLTLGESFEQNVGELTCSPQLRYIDWEHPHNNSFHVTAEYRVERMGSHKHLEPDIVCFINGIPMVVIECKCPQDKNSLEAAIKQQLRNQEREQIPQLYIYSQLLLALNKNEGSYATTGTAPRYWSTLGGDSARDDAALAALVAKKPLAKTHEELFSGIFRKYREEFELQALEPRQVTEQDRVLAALCQPERLLDFAKRFVLYDEGGSVKKIARFHQYETIQRVLERIHQRRPDGGRKGGVVWHTQGSGKSLTMVMLAKALALDPSIPNPRIVLVTDRIDLDSQLWKTFAQCGKSPVMAKTGKHLMQLLQEGKAEIITTLIDKFNSASKSQAGFKIEDDNLFVLIDEIHRSNYGEANARMMTALPKACFIGFTGTPLMKKEKNTAQRFGGFIGQNYTIRDAVDDKAVVPLFYEGRHVMQEVNKKGIDNMFKMLSEGLSREQKADLKRKFSSKDELNSLESRLYLIAWDVSQDFSKNWQGTGFKGQVTAQRKSEAIALKRLIDGFGKVSCELIISGPDEREGDGEDAPLSQDKAMEMAFWKSMMDKYGNEKEYNRSLIESFKKGDHPEILIVVDKLLTGFDAPRNRVLYIARKLREHNLLQAIARVNRLYPGKDYGLIIDYYGVLSSLNEALELYHDLGEKFDPEDLAGTLNNVSSELKKLPDQQGKVWSFFSEVKNRQDAEEFELSLADEDTRSHFYNALSHFNRTLKLALSSVHWMDAASEAEIENYKADAVFFQKLRASVKRRYAEEIDYRDYESQIKRMLNNYVQADEIVQVVDPVNIFDKKEFAAEIAKIESPRSRADTIANRTKRTISEKMGEDPFFYRKFSLLIELAIDDYHQERISEAEYLAKMEEYMENVRQGSSAESPHELRERDLARAIFGALKEILPEKEKLEEAWKMREGETAYAAESKILVSAACEVEDIIRRHSIIGWRENEDAQNDMRNEIDDYFFKTRQAEKAIFTLNELDEFTEKALSIARKRVQDV